MLSVGRDKYSTINFEETELRLGLGLGLGLSDQLAKNNNGKRGFSETEGDGASVDLKLNLSTTAAAAATTAVKDVKVEQSLGGDQKLEEKVTTSNPTDSVKPPAKAQVVGWPPVRSFRKNIAAVQKKSSEEQADKKAATALNNNTITNGAAFVKVSMDGAPYLRKVDLKLYKSYQELSDALGKMFSSFTIEADPGVLEDHGPTIQIENLPNII